MRWGFGLNFHDPISDHSKLSRPRTGVWSQCGLLDRLMDDVIRRCCEAGLVSGHHLSGDGTEVKADAGVKSLTRRGPRQSSDGDPPEGSGIEEREPRPAGGCKGRGKRYANETHLSTTNPDARLDRKSHQRFARLRYLVHDLMDTKRRVIWRP